MPEESTTPDLVALTKAMGAARDVDETLCFYAADAVFDGSRLGLEIYVGRDAIRKSLEDWLEIYEDHEEEEQEIRDLGNGVVFSATRLSARPRAADRAVRVHTVGGFVTVWAEGKISREVVYPDVDEARAAAERLAEDRG